MMESKEFDLFKNIELTLEDKKYFEQQNMISDLIIKLIKRRMELKLSQRAVAEKTGIKQPMIARIENFETMPRLDTIVKIANALELKLDYAKTVNISVYLENNIDYKIEQPSISYGAVSKIENFLTIS